MGSSDHNVADVRACTITNVALQAYASMSCDTAHRGLTLVPLHSFCLSIFTYVCAREYALVVGCKRGGEVFFTLEQA